MTTTMTTTLMTQKRVYPTDVGGEERRGGLCEAVGGQYVPHGDPGGRRGGDGNHDDGGVGDSDDDDSDDSFEARTMSCISL